MEYNPPEMTIAQMDELLAFLPAFTPKNYEPWGASQPYDFFNALPYNGTVRAFRDTYMDVCKDIHPYKRLPEDGPEVEESSAIFTQFGTIEAMQTASANQIRRLLMLCTRGERFGFSSTGDLLEAGVITAALHRLQVLYKELQSADDDDPIEDVETYDDFFRLTTSDSEAMRLIAESSELVNIHSSDDAPFIFWVGRVKWGSPYRPSIYFTPFRRWKKPPTPLMLARARQAALHNTRFFRECTYCKQATNVGHMYDASTCQGCASRYMGVVY